MVKILAGGTAFLAGDSRAGTAINQQKTTMYLQYSGVYSIEAR